MTVGTRGDSNDDDGVVGTTTAGGKSGVFGFSAQPGSNGVAGISQSGNGMYAKSDSGYGLYGESGTGRGVHGNGAEAGVGGDSQGGFGVFGHSMRNSGVLGTSERGQGVTAIADNDVAVYAKGGSWAGVFDGAVVINKGPNPKEVLWHPNLESGSLIVNDGNLYVNKGDLNVDKGDLYVDKGNLYVDKGNLHVKNGDVFLGGADCAEDFDVSISSSAEPGTVLVIAANGSLTESTMEYDRRVAGVVSGAGRLKPGLILGRTTDSGNQHRAPVALVGRIYCRVEAISCPITVGDLLTTSSMPGRAMKVVDHQRANGAVLGKAMQSLDTGIGLLMILVSLQ